MNIVFDLGGVVVRWEPDEILQAVFPVPAEAELARNGLMKHQDWRDMDLGLIDNATALSRAAERTGLDKERLTALLESVPPSLEPRGEVLELVREIVRAGNRVYVLSNMPFPSIDYLERKHDFLEMFHGRIISCRIRMAKPERPIYEHLLREYNLAPAETVFADDLPENLVEPAKLGIHTIHFRSASQTREQLVGMGALTTERPSE